MSFRRADKHSEKQQWQSWLTEHARLIAASGLPTIVLRDEEHWFDFLDHGYLDHHDDPGEFRIAGLGVRQKAAFFQLVLTTPHALETIVARRLVMDLIHAVEQRYSIDE